MLRQSFGGLLVLAVILVALLLVVSSVTPPARVRIVVQRSFGTWDRAAPPQFRLRVEHDEEWTSFLSRIAARAGHRGKIADLRLFDTTRAELKVWKPHRATSSLC